MSLLVQLATDKLQLIELASHAFVRDLQPRPSAVQFLKVENCVGVEYNLVDANAQSAQKPEDSAVAGIVRVFLLAMDQLIILSKQLPGL